MFFSDIPEVARIYPISKKITERYKIRRYGFHGLSHKNVSRNLKGKTIVCHLGSGSSISAILDEKAIEISMGFTPLEGIMMRTRSGTIDPGIIFFLEKRGKNIRKLLEEDSGFLGLTGFDDFRDILLHLKKSKKCLFAYNLFVYQIAKTIGSYIAILNGLDNLVFTAKIGENVPKLRKDVCDYLSFMNIQLDKEKNRLNYETISSRKSRVNVFVRKTDEEKTAVEEVLKVL